MCCSPSTDVYKRQTSGWTRRFISLPVMHPDGGAGEKALVILSAPTDWEYDNYTTFTPVSYTHLDVYKRQCPNRRTSWCIRRRPETRP